MKKSPHLRKRSFLVATVLASALGLSGAAMAQAPIVIKFSHVVAEQTPKGQAALKVGGPSRS